jgi:hypothetical protein
MDSEALTRWHVGPWTMRATAPGEPHRPGVRRTPDEANFDVVGLARILGKRQSGGEELQVRLWQNELRPTHTRVCGRHTLSDPANAAALAAKAAESLAWLAARAPAGYRFVRTDAVYLEPLDDLTAPVVAVEYVIEVARTRATSLPDTGADPAGSAPAGTDLAAADLAAADLAAAHARRSGDAWVAATGALVLAGPFPTAAAAVAAITTARAELARALRHAGHTDLADTATRWPPVPTDTPMDPS